MGTLWPQRIPRYSHVDVESKVPVMCGSDPTYVVTPDGRRWVRKTEGYTGFQPLISEAIAWLLAKELAVPVPDAAFVEGSDDDRGWLSAHIRETRHWQVSYSHLVRNWDRMGSFIALDAIIFNDDRHRENILLAKDGAEYTGWLIDAGDALVGQPSDFPSLGEDDVPTGENIAQGLPYDLLAPGAKKAAAIAETLDANLLKEFVFEACEIARSASDVERLSNQLIARCKRASILVDRYLAILRSREEP